MNLRTEKMRMDNYLFLFYFVI